MSLHERSREWPHFLSMVAIDYRVITVNTDAVQVIVTIVATAILLLATLWLSEIYLFVFKFSIFLQTIAV